ncbi:MAG: hypothetical protein K6E20_02155, partial [Acholeplasmatales bacterium]|nr:hypothetical protein [Acholeplasmatales bacterium]
MIFEYWSADGVNEFVGTNDITAETVLQAIYKEDDGTSEKIVLNSQIGLEESAYIDVKEYTNAEGYSVYDSSTNNLVKLSSKDYYIVDKGDYVRIYLFGLTQGSHKFLVSPVIGGVDAQSLGSQATVSVEAYDRSGYAFFNYNEGVGAYKDDGTLKENAIVLYVTDENKNSIELTYGGITVTGIGNILNSAGQETTEEGHEGQCKMTSDGDTYYGKANSNQGIIKLLAQNNIPLVVRFVGTVSSSGLYEQGAFDPTNDPLIDGLTHFNSWDCGGTYKSTDGDQGHMARMKSGKDITLEGVGSDATLDGWGIHFMCESSAPELGKSFEVRNLKFINTPEDAVGMEGVQADGAITASVERCWIHNNEFYCPNITKITDNDKSQGDGSCDFKRGQYFTCSYNYFEKCHKTCLVGSSDSSLQFNLTYHHNFFYMCGSRGPLARQANIHMYNNLFFGQTDYAMNPRANAYIFSESNLFYACKNPMKIDSGAIKSYNDMFSSYIDACDCTAVTDKSTTVANSCAYGSIDYSAFDTNSTQSYIPSNDYFLETDHTAIRKTIQAKTGVSKGALISASNVSLSDMSILGYLGLSATVNELEVGKTVTPGKISKSIYAFKISEYAQATIDTDGVLVNEAGINLLNGSGTVILAPGTYFVQASTFQPYSTKTPFYFKDFNVNSVELVEYDSEELNQQLIAEYETAYNALPETVAYTDEHYNLIKACMDKYNALGDLQSRITNYSNVENKFNEYQSLGKTYVENLISAIGTVDENSGDKITSARLAYNTLVSRCSSVVIDNYSTLTNAESEFEAYAVTACINAINAIGEVTLDSEDAILQAEYIYSTLNSTQKTQVTNYETLQTARETYDSLVAVNNVETLLANANTYELCVEAKASYTALTTAQKASVDSDILKAFNAKYTVLAIDEISETVTKADRDIVKTARSLYDALTTEEQALVTNYAKLTAAEEVMATFA